VNPDPGRLALVTGAGGDLGAPLVAALRQAGWQVRAHEGSTLDRDGLTAAAAGADVVFHLAERPDDGFADPIGSHLENAEATLAVLEAARAAQVRRVVYASSWQAAEATTLHAIQKRAGELYCQLYYRLHGLETISLRYPPGFSEGDAAQATYRAADGDEGVGAVVTAEKPRS